MIDCQMSTDDGASCDTCWRFPYPDVQPAATGWNYDPLYDPFILTLYQEDDSNYDFGKFYYPINVFWNEYLGKCTSECSADGTHHINPQPYNPIDVILWEQLWAADTNDNRRFSPANLRRNLFYPEYNTNDPDCCPQETPDQEYWIPYNISLSFDCICDFENGFVYDNEVDDGRCFDCSSLHEECTTCSYDTLINDGWSCDSCGSENLMIAPNMTGCVPKILGCSVDVAD